MEIAEEYHGDKYIAVVRNGKRYEQVTRSSLEGLHEGIRHLRQAYPEVVQMFNGVNMGAMFLIGEAVRTLNHGGKVNLDDLLIRDDEDED